MKPTARSQRCRLCLAILLGACLLSCSCVNTPKWNHKGGKDTGEWAFGKALKF
jgi:hypothetical protein